jgi:RNA polymerase sigma-70 factor (ECF subfamily)
VEVRRRPGIERLNDDYPVQSDEELAQLVGNGDQKALEMLYDRYFRQAIGLAYRLVGQVELAEEVVQETFLRFWERPDLYQVGRGRFVGWLLSVVHHRAINERRRSAFRLNISADQVFSSDGGNADEGVTLLNRLSDETPGLHDLVWLELQREAVRQALDQLSYPQRRVIELAYFKGLNQREIAQELGEPLGTIKSRVRMALQKLRTILIAQGLGVNAEFVSESEVI